MLPRRAYRVIEGRLPRLCICPSLQALLASLAPTAPTRLSDGLVDMIVVLLCLQGEHALKRDVDRCRLRQEVVLSIVGIGRSVSC